MTDVTETTAGEARPNKRTLAKAATASKVMEAARALFAAEGGYEQATIRSIAKAAGMSTGAVFANYDDKAELYRAIHGHLPVTPELGRQALLALRALTVPLGGEYGADAVDELKAIDLVRERADALLEQAGFPPLALKVDPDAACVDVIAKALRDPHTIAVDGVGFVHHALGQDGERVDVTAIAQ